MGLRTAHAIYQDGRLIFADPAMEPEDGAEVVVTFLERFVTELTPDTDPIVSLRGRGKGEKLVEKLLESRQEDRELDERSRRHLRSSLLPG